MKSINWVVNGVLALAILILYVLHFSSGTATNKKATMQTGGGTRVAYFEIDYFSKKMGSDMKCSHCL